MDWYAIGREPYKDEKVENYRDCREIYRETKRKTENTVWVAYCDQLPEVAVI